MTPLWLSGIATAVLVAGIAWYLAPLSPGVLLLQFAFTPRAFGELIHFWSAEQLLRFRQHLPADCLLLLGYGAFGYLLASRTSLFRVFGTLGRRWAMWALPLAAAFDAVENALHWWLTEVPRFGLTWPYLLAAGSASAKWLLLLAYGLSVTLALARSEQPPSPFRR
jgi:hypothetical protein